MIQVLGAIAYGEWKAYQGANERAAMAASEQERRAWRKQAAEELRHFKGFVKRLEALGADPDRAMRPYRRSLDAFHAGEPTSSVQGAIWDFMGEGVADDLLGWVRRVADADTAAFIEGVLADEVEHEARAATVLRAQLRADPEAHRQAALAALQMVGRMLTSGGPNPAPFAAFLRLGRPHELLGALVGGQLRRLRAIGLRPYPVIGRATPSPAT
jgi:DNA-binding ferritin-like protein (Dps family)